MSNTNRVIMLLVLAGAIAAVLVLKNRDGDAGAVADRATPSTDALPRVVDLGSHKCIACKMMTPILEELETEYADVFKVEFIDVWKDPDAGEQFGIRMIPTQIFYDAAGRELFRHEGFFGKEEILAKWREFGVAVEGGKD